MSPKRDQQIRKRRHLAGFREVSVALRVPSLTSAACCQGWFRPRLWQLLLLRQTHSRTCCQVCLKPGCQNTSCHVLLVAPDVQAGNEGRSILRALVRTARALTLLSQKTTAGLDGRVLGTFVLKRAGWFIPLSFNLSRPVLCSGQSMQSSSSYRHLDTLGACHEYHISGYAQRKPLLYDTSAFKAVRSCRLASYRNKQVLACLQFLSCARPGSWREVVQ